VGWNKTEGRRRIEGGYYLGVGLEGDENRFCAGYTAGAGEAVGEGYLSWWERCGRKVRVEG